jgi:hypothetical protein
MFSDFWYFIEPLKILLPLIVLAIALPFFEKES